MIKEKQYTSAETRLIIIFILCFATVTDVVSSLVAKTELMGSFRWFLVLGTAFILQHQFKTVRVVLMSTLGFFVVVKLIALLVAIDAETFADFLNHVFLLPSVMPLYVMITFITILMAIFYKTYNVWR